MLSSSRTEPRRFRRDQKSGLGTAIRPLADKTPLPNRVAFQLPFEKNKTQKPTLSGLDFNSRIDNENANVLQSVKRPSSLRKHLKLPKASTPMDVMETPMNQGHHWDVSDGDIDISPLQSGLQEVKNLEDDFCSDEIEYCAPNTLDLPYQPPFDFDLPDYTEVGKKLHKLAFSFPFDDAPGPLEPEFPVKELEPVTWEISPLPTLESDDPFSVARRESKLANHFASKSTLKTDFSSHRRAQSSLARIGSSSARTTTSSVSKTSVTDTNAAGTVRKAHSKPTSNTLKPTSSVRTMQPPKKFTVVNVQQTRATSTLPRSGTRPHTSLSMAAQKSNTNNDPLVFHQQIDDDDFMFNVT